MDNNQNADNAKRLLRHYLSMAVEAKGYRFDGDSKVEIDDIVDSIVAAARPVPVQVAHADGPDMIAQSGELLRKYQATLATPKIDPAVVVTSAVLAVAAELRAVCNALQDGAA